jgi:hypothetical protein
MDYGDAPSETSPPTRLGDDAETLIVPVSPEAFKTAIQRP